SRVALGLFALSMASTAFADTPLDPMEHEIPMPSGGKVIRLLPVHHDFSHEQVVQDRLFYSPPLTDTLPSSYEIPHTSLPPVRDQGRRGTCAYFATVGLLEHYYDKKYSSPSLNLS